MPRLSIAQKSSMIPWLGEGWSEIKVGNRFYVPKSTSVHNVNVWWNQRIILKRQMENDRPKVSTRKTFL